MVHELRFWAASAQNALSQSVWRKPQRLFCLPACCALLQALTCCQPCLVLLVLTWVLFSLRYQVIVGNFCATIRKQRPPEPYKGKGIRYEGETIMMKEGKGGGKKK